MFQAAHCWYGGRVVDHQVPLENQKPDSKKKAYRKPNVQEYGTLAEITQTAAHLKKGTVDNFAPGWQTRT